jgi:hypothetical protein
MSERERVFISDAGDVERVDATVEYTAALIADDRAAMLIGTEIRDLLREGKTIFVKTHSAKTTGT